MAYIGSNDKARRIKSVYIGVNNVARKVTTGYVGVDDVARKWWGTQETTDPDVPVNPPTSNAAILTPAWRIYPVKPDSVSLDNITTIKLYDTFPSDKYSIEDWQSCWYPYSGENSTSVYLYGEEILIVGNGSGRIKLTSAAGVFSINGNYYLKDIEGLELLDTSDCSNFSSMFSNWNPLFQNRSHLDLRNFDTSNATNMSYMFGTCGFTTLDLTSFDTSKVTDMSGMFHNCMALKTIYVSDKWDTSNADTTDMFRNCGCSSVTYV